MTYAIYSGYAKRVAPAPVGGEQQVIWGNDVIAPTSVIQKGGGSTPPGSCRYIAPPNTTGGFLSWCYNIILREDKRDGLSGKFLIEHSANNYCFYSKDFSQATWTKTTCSVTSTTGVSPDGKLDCRTVAFAGAATDKIYRTVTGLAASDDYCTSFWVRSTTGPNTVRIYNKNKDGTVYLSSDFAISTTWTRIENYRTWSAGAGVAEVGVQNGTAGAAHSIQLWGAQVEDGPIATSNINTTTVAVNRGPDRVACSNQYNAFGMDKIFLEGDYNFTVTPNYSSNEAVTHGVLIYGTVYSDRNGVIFTPVWNVPHSRYEYTVSLRQDSVDKYALSGLTWSRNQDLKISVDMVAGTISVSGATSGDGTSTPGTPGFTTVYGAGQTVASGGASGLGINPVMSTAGWFGGFRIGPIRTSTLNVSGTVSASQIRSDFYLSNGAFSYYNSPPNTTGGFLTRMLTAPFGEDKRDGVSGFYISEPSRTNYILYSKDFSQAAWVKTTCTVGAGSTTAPDGLIDCKTVSFTASALAGLAATCPGITTNSQKVICSVWARCAAGATNIRLSFLDENAVLTTSADLPISATWTRVQLNIANSGTLGGVCAMGILNGTAGVAQDIELWGAQAEIAGSYYGITSNITNVGTANNRGASSIQIPIVPFLRDGSKFGIRVRPMADISGTQPNKLLSVSGADTTNYLMTVLGGSTPSLNTAAFAPQAVLNSGIAGYPTNLQVDYEADLANGILGANGVYGAATGCIGIPSEPSATQYGFTIGYPEATSSGIPIRISLPYAL